MLACIILSHDGISMWLTEQRTKNLSEFVILMKIHPEIQHIYVE